MSKTDGGPAFPAPDYVVDSARIQEDAFQRMGQTRGLSLRDWFAGQAIGDVARNLSWHKDDLKKAARIAYEFADAMLKERDSGA